MKRNFNGHGYFVTCSMKSPTGKNRTFGSNVESSDYCVHHILLFCYRRNIYVA